MRFKKLDGLYQFNRYNKVCLITFLNSNDSYIIEYPATNQVYFDRRINDIIKDDIMKSRDTMQAQELKLDSDNQYFKLIKVK